MELNACLVTVEIKVSFSPKPHHGCGSHIKIRDRRESLEGEKCQALWSSCRNSVTPTHVMHVTTEAAALEQTGLEDFIAFATRSQPVLRQHAHRICGNWHTADDLVQETLIILYQRWNRITKDGRSAYARTVLAHLWANERRSARSHLESLPGVLPELPHEEEDEEVARLDIRFIIARLPLRTRHAILLRYWAGISTEETAQILGIRPGSARSLLSRAFTSMRESLRPVSITACPEDGRIVAYTDGHAPCK